MILKFPDVWFSRMKRANASVATTEFQYMWRVEWVITDHFLRAPIIFIQTILDQNEAVK